MSLPVVFISYSHRDEEWKDKLKRHLLVLKQVGHLDVWDDRRIQAGETWYPEIRQAMESAAAAICLISADFLSSDFCAREEIPFLLERRQNDGLVLVPVLVGACPWKYVPWLRVLQMLPRDGRDIRSAYATDSDPIFAEIAEHVAAKIEERRGSQQPKKGLSGPGPTKERAFSATRGPREEEQRPEEERWRSIDLDTPRDESFELRRLHVIDMPSRFIDPADAYGCGGIFPEKALRRQQRQLPALFGRGDELQILFEALEESAGVISIVGPAGCGKSALVAHWLQRLRDQDEDLDHAFGWVFAKEGAGSPEAFLAAAIRDFRVSREKASWREFGSRLAQAISRQRTLLVLDALDELQNEDGTLRAPLLHHLLESLTAQPGKALTILTTRHAVAGIRGMRELRLGPVTPAAGRALLRARGLQGSDEELEAISQRLGNQPAALVAFGAG